MQMSLRAAQALSPFRQAGLRQDELLGECEGQEFCERGKMNRLKAILVLMFLAAICGSAASAQQKPFIDWKILKNPILSYPDWSIKDTALAYRDGTFYVFFSAFYPSTDDAVCHVVEVATKDQ